MARVPWIGQSATYRDSKISDLKMMNCFAEVVESKQGKTVLAARSTPGLRPFTTVPQGAYGLRGLYTSFNGGCFAVRGDAFVQLFGPPPAPVVLRGTLQSTDGPVQMADNGSSILLVDERHGYTYEMATGVFAQIQDAIFPGASRVDYLDGYFVFRVPESVRFGWSNLLSTEWDSLNFASAEGSPDPLISLLVQHRELWLFGTHTTEVWSSSGIGETPFVRNQSVFLEVGCAASHSPARVGDTHCWLSATREGHGQVLMATGYAHRRISTHSVEQALQGYAVLHDALAWGEQLEGHALYCLTFPHASATWVYDLTTDLWHERGQLDPASGGWARHPANCSTFALGQHLVGDVASGRIWALDPHTYDNDGAPLVLEVSPPPLFDAEGLRRIAQSRLELDAEVGGLGGGPATASAGMASLLAPWMGGAGGHAGTAVPAPDVHPHVGLFLSNDGGQTWGTEIARTLGALGKTRHHVEWHRLGAAHDRRCRIRISDPVKRVLLGLVTDVEVLR